MDINQLLKDISIRYACKNVSKFVAELERFLDTKLKPDIQKHEYVYDEEFELSSDAKNVEKSIRKFGQCQTLFSVEKCSRIFNELHAVFKFHPENAV